MGDDNVINTKDYILLKDFRMEIELQGGTLSFCFWVYLIHSNTAFPASIINQVYSDITSSSPFLALNEKKIMMLLPLSLLQKEAPDPCNYASLTEAQHVVMGNEIPMEIWIHVGCEVLTDVLRLHINGEIVRELPLSSSLNKDSLSDGSRKITLVGAAGDHGLQGYVYNAEVLPLHFSISDHYIKIQCQDIPLQLSIDHSSTSEIEEGNDGIWNIVGGKASCRRIFSLDVVLSNAISQAIDKDIEVVASLLYADNGLPVEKTSEDEAPLLISYDGIEFASVNRPSKLVHGRASFKLKISQLSSKCDNRLFRIKFEMPEFRGHQFLDAFSHPIRCISRSRNPRSSSLTWKRSTSGGCSLNEFQSFGLDNESVEFPHNSVHEIKPTPASKRIKLEQQITSVLEKPEEECNSHASHGNQAENAVGTKLDGRPENLEEAEKLPSDSESTEERGSDLKVMSSIGYSISDVTIFKYCLGGLTDKALLLKEVATSASEEDLFRFAHEVSLYSGCSHHRRQIMIGKRLIEEGTKVWNSIAQSHQAVHWENVIFEIDEQFMKIACCNRSLIEQDFELLRRIAGCREYVAQENFEKMWCWLYPIAFTLSRKCINTMWSSTSPRWIEGFITKEEAELSLQGPRGLQEPGTFILRFPTSRSWPHPDAGSLIVTYVGNDYTVHHRLLCLDYIYSEESQTNVRLLQDMLLAEPELSRLGRLIRRQ
ncbi:SH2 domain-containing protein A isoform X1 [Ricinus communis]|uniref:SH2 domain-containing protein A isoform X1 n=1 Tax=Ricinus communis TaxID=3988 RepID=UPI00201AB4A8|nr:SH2 domain-containing protein A isoform X1 [Ricinus communis]